MHRLAPGVSFRHLPGCWPLPGARSVPRPSLPSSASPASSQWRVTFGAFFQPCGACRRPALQPISAEGRGLAGWRRGQTGGPGAGGSVGQRRRARRVGACGPDSGRRRAPSAADRRAGANTGPAGTGRPSVAVKRAAGRGASGCC